MVWMVFGWCFLVPCLLWLFLPRAGFAVTLHKELSEACRTLHRTLHRRCVLVRGGPRDHKKARARKFGGGGFCAKEGLLPWPALTDHTPPTTCAPHRSARAEGLPAWEDRKRRAIGGRGGEDGQFLLHDRSPAAAMGGSQSWAGQRQG